MAQKTLKINCISCQNLLAESSFYKTLLRKKEYRCISCCIKKSTIYQKENKERVNLSHRLYAKNNPQKTRGYQLKYRSLHHAELLIKEKAERDAIRFEVLSVYSNNTLACECCSERHIEFLALDHKNGGGAQERRKLGNKGSGEKFYRHLKKNGYPDGYRVLCHNCNMSFGFYKRCPHQVNGQ